MKFAFFFILAASMPLVYSQTSHKNLNSFIEKYCSDCHADGADKGGLDFDKLKYSLSDEGIFAEWEGIYDRVMSGEMPPKKKKKRPTKTELESFHKTLSAELYKHHGQTRGTVLRRLNNQEYENTLNDIFGTNERIADMLPEDGRSHEFDNVGESLGVSMIQLQQYMKGIKTIMKKAIENSSEAKPPTKRTAKYQDHDGYKAFIKDKWKELPDGAIVRFETGNYPNGMVRGTAAKVSGYYKVSVTGYGYQTTKPLFFSVGGISHTAGAEKPIYRYFTFPPSKDTTVEFTTFIKKGYMIRLEPYGINDRERYKRKKNNQTIADYKGPGLAIKHVTIEGPLIDEFPSKGHKLIFDGLTRVEVPGNPKHMKKSWYKPTFKIESADPVSVVTKSLTNIAKIAFRKENPDISPYIKLFKAQLEQGEKVEYALQTAIIAIFTSTDFLYLHENPGRLNDNAIAARMSYFLNRTFPDERLVELAKQGKLSQDASIRESEMNRLMAKPEFERFIKDFTDAWLNLRTLDETLPDKKLFPEYDPFLRFSMPLETQAFFKELITSNLSVSNVVKSNFAMLNARLAEHYKIPGVNHTDIRKVKLPKDNIRGGFLTQASVLKVSANGSNTSPVLRGVWVLERIMGTTPPPPPAGVPGVEPDTRGASTLRELLDKHRDSPNCNSCHTKIDPLGFALEVFNPVGSYREHFRTMGKGKRAGGIVHGKYTSYKYGLPVDATGQFADGRKFTTFIEFRDHLAKEKAVLARALTKKLLIFATGREMGFSDREEIESIVQSTAKNDYRVRDIFTQIINSKIFLTK